MFKILQNKMLVTDVLVKIVMSGVQGLFNSVSIVLYIPTED